MLACWNVSSHSESFLMPLNRKFFSLCLLLNFFIWSLPPSEEGKPIWVSSGQVYLWSSQLWGGRKKPSDGALLAPGIPFQRRKNWTGWGECSVCVLSTLLSPEIMDLLCTELKKKNQDYASAQNDFEYYNQRDTFSPQKEIWMYVELPGH